MNVDRIKYSVLITVVTWVILLVGYVAWSEFGDWAIRVTVLAVLVGVLVWLVDWATSKSGTGN